MAITSKADRKTLHRGQDVQETTSARISAGKQDQNSQNVSVSTRARKSKALAESRKLGSATQEQTSTGSDETISITPAHEIIETQAPTTSTRRTLIHHGARVTITLKLNLGTGANQR